MLTKFAFLLFEMATLRSLSATISVQVLPVSQNVSSSRLSRMNSAVARKTVVLKAFSVAGRRSPSLRRRYVSLVQCSATAVDESTDLSPAITLSEKALSHLTKMRGSIEKDLLLRLGVRQGGCSGYSYLMDFEERGNVREEDSVIEYEGFSMVCDPKSLLFLYGMQLDYSDALIGGGFSFSNPNASSTCGCGKSFAA